MREAFKPGTLVRWNIPDGGFCEIARYDLEGFYVVNSVPDRRLLIAKEDDLLLPEEWKERYGEDKLKD